MTEHRYARLERVLLIAWIVVNLGIGLLIVHDYGMSFDEPNYYLYAKQSLDAYKSVFGRLYEPAYGPSNLVFYGPSFIMAVEAAVRTIRQFSLNLFEVDIWHYSYFIIFQLSGLCLYALAKRWFSRWTAWAVLSLFITQPLLWGHAFINPKDIPFIFFFAASIWTGFRLGDSLPGESPAFSLQPVVQGFSHNWQHVELGRRKQFLVWSTLLAVALLFSLGLAKPIIEQVIQFFYSAPLESWAGKLMKSFAPHAVNVPVENYIARAQSVYAQLAWTIFPLGLVALGGWLTSLITEAGLRASLKRMWLWIEGTIQQAFLNEKSHLKLQNAINILRQTQQMLIQPHVIQAGIFLGLTTSIRSLGPLAGGITILYMFAKTRQRSLPMAFAYLLWAGFVTYLTWPYLWLAPISHYFESLSMMSSFPWQGRVLFNDHFYRAYELPRSYLPVLLNIQLTEPLLLLYYIGLGFLARSLLRDQLKLDLLLYIGFGSILPLVSLVVVRSPLYDNFRQLLFLLPGLFLIAGFTLEAIFDRLRQHVLRLALILVFCLPGLVALFRLHPYQYVYYNSLVGGVEQASARFEMDYWRISMRDMAFALNEIAEPEAKVVVVGAPTIFNVYSRPDLVVEKYQSATLDLNGDYDYAILPSRWNALDFYPQAEIVFSVEREGAILAVIKRVRGESFE